MSKLVASAGKGYLILNQEDEAVAIVTTPTGDKKTKTPSVKAARSWIRRELNDEIDRGSGDRLGREG